uniref:Ssemaphorin 4F n=1 Tax=Oryzias latipes TaxID=8090 RepID=A0A3P9M5C8_ORYLA
MTLNGRIVLLLLPASLLFFSPSGSEAASLGGVDITLGPQTFKNVTDFSTFLLDRSSGVLYLGAKDAILAVDTNNLNQQPRKIVWDVPEDKRKSCVAKGKTEVDCNNYIRLLEFLGDGRIYVCGTYAFDPHCAFLEQSSFTLEKTEDGGIKTETGKGKCPFEPAQHYTAVMASGILYTAATSNFLGTLFDISRATGPEQERIRTERSINWLNDPEFVSSAFIEASADANPTGDDDKIYFFFTEMAKEYELYTKVKVPRVARVCKSDVGGMKTLQRRWTTFLKAQLVCEDKSSDRRFNVLKDVFTVQHFAGDPSSTHFYGLFSSQWEPEEVSAVCIFSLTDINKVMDGSFKELKKNCDNWMNPEPPPTPRPGQCLNSALKAEGFESSLKLPDKVLTFVRDHPLMENSVTAAPVLVRRGIGYTKLAVTLTGRGAVLHLGTDRGEIHKVAVVGQNTTLLQESPVFPSNEAVNNILLYQGWALVGSPLSLARIQAEGCALFSSCTVCARARGLGCVWSNEEEACSLSEKEPGPGDVVDAALKKCGSLDGRCSPIIQDMRVSLGQRLLLPCLQLSPRPCSWEHPPHRLTRQHHTDLDVTVTEDSLGIYVCSCQEGGPSVRDPTTCLRATYHLSLEGPTVGGSKSPAGSRHIIAVYILFFFLGLLCAVIIMYFVNRREKSCQHQAPDTSLSSDKGRDFTASFVTPQSPSSTSLFSKVFQMEKQNGTTTSTTTTSTLLSNQGNGGPHSGSLSNSKPSNGINGNSSSGELKLASEMLVGNVVGRRTVERASPGGGEMESGEGYGIVGGLGDGSNEGLKGLEEELASFPMFRSSAPLAPCEESSI